MPLSKRYFVDKVRFHQCAKYGTVPILHCRELEPNWLGTLSSKPLSACTIINTLDAARFFLISAYDAKLYTHAPPHKAKLF